MTESTSLTGPTSFTEGAGALHLSVLLMSYWYLLQLPLLLYISFIICIKTIRNYKVMNLYTIIIFYLVFYKVNFFNQNIFNLNFIVWLRKLATPVKYIADNDKPLYIKQLL